MKIRMYLTIVVLLLSLSFVPACTAATVDTATPTTDQVDVALAQDPQVYKIGYIPAGAFSPFFVAQEKGYFAEQGLQVEMQSFRTGGEMIAPLSLGQLDIGAGEFGPAYLNAVSQGLDVKIALPLSSTQEGYGYLPFLVRKELYDSGEVTTIADLKGRNVALNATRGTTECALAMALAQGNLEIEDVAIQIIPFPDMLQALANGAVDAALVQYPLAGKALAPGENGEAPVAAVLLPGDQLGGHIQFTAIYFGKNLLDPAYKEVATKFAIALLKADRDLAAENWREDEVLINAIVQYTNVSAEAIKNGISPYFDPNGEMYWDSLLGFQDYYLEHSYLEYTEPIAQDQLVNDSFRTAALEQIGGAQ